MIDLRALQEQVLAAITTGNTAAASVHVKTAGSLSTDDRLGIYAHGYLARLLGCLTAQYPGLLAVTGEQVFALFAQAYVQACPPTSYSLADVGAGFPDFLERTRPEGVDAATLPAAVARLERARFTHSATAVTDRGSCATNGRSCV